MMAEKYLLLMDCYQRYGFVFPMLETSQPLNKLLRPCLKRYNVLKRQAHVRDIRQHGVRMQMHPVYRKYNIDILSQSCELFSLFNFYAYPKFI